MIFPVIDLPPVVEIMENTSTAPSAPFVSYFNGQVVQVGSHTWGVQNAGKSWSLRSNGSEYIFDVKAGDVWPGDMKRSLIWNRSQIVSNGAGGTGPTIMPNTPVHFSFDFMFEDGPINDRSGVEFMELINTGAFPLFLQVATYSGVEYLQIITGYNASGATAGATLTYNAYPGGGNSSVGPELTLVRCVWHHIDVDYKYTLGQQGGYAIVTYDGVTLYNYEGPLGYSTDTDGLEYQFGNYGNQPPPGSPDTDQIIHIRNISIPDM